MDIIILGDAIKNLVPNEPFTIVWQDRNNGTTADFQTLKFEDDTISNPSDDDIVAEYNILKAAADTEKAQKEIDAANGNQKLLDLGLTQAEATAITGYKPSE